jgi:hypothetical protein
VTQPAPEYEGVEDWRLLQEVLEERDAEWWADDQDDDS